MVFVSPYVPPPELSPRAQELGQRMALTIAEYQQKYPDLSKEEVRQALEVAAGHTAPGRGRPAAVLGGVTAAIAVAAGLGAYLVGPGHGPASVPSIAVGIGIVAAGLALVAARSRRG